MLLDAEEDDEGGGGCTSGFGAYFEAASAIAAGEPTTCEIKLKLSLIDRFKLEADGVDAAEGGGNMERSSSEDEEDEDDIDDEGRKEC